MTRLGDCSRRAGHLAGFIREVEIDGGDVPGRAERAGVLRRPEAVLAVRVTGFAAPESQVRVGRGRRAAQEQAGLPIKEVGRAAGGAVRRGSGAGEAGRIAGLAEPVGAVVPVPRRAVREALLVESEVVRRAGGALRREWAEAGLAERIAGLAGLRCRILVLRSGAVEHAGGLGEGRIEEER